MKILYVTYNGLTEPLGRRQVLPYLLGLARRGWSVTVLSFEKAETADKEAVRVVAEALEAERIRWLRRRYHRRPSLPATAYDLVGGVLTGLAHARDVRLVHARSTVPAVIARTIARRRGVPWIYDVRGLIAQEYADAGHWRRHGRVYRWTDSVEKRCLRTASGLVFLTQAIAEDLRIAGALPPATPLSVIPCAVDLDVFQPSHADRQAVRAALGLGTAPVLVYAGNLGSWYAVSEMLRFFAVARQEVPGLRFLVLTWNPAEAQRGAEAQGLAEHVVVKSLRPDDVPAHLAAADAGICFLTASASKRASSPTKYGEYLASGLPIVTDGWTGDATRFRGETAWIQVDRFGDDEYRDAARQLSTLVAAPDAARTAARDLAARELSLETAIERYDGLYRRVIGSGP